VATIVIIFIAPINIYFNKKIVPSHDGRKEGLDPLVNATDGSVNARVPPIH